MNQIEILKSALTARDEEILGYQINTDNYSRAIDKINSSYADNKKIVEFGERLAEMLEQNEIEQLKAKIIRDVIADQINETESV